MLLHPSLSASETTEPLVSLASVCSCVGSDSVSQVLQRLLGSSAVLRELAGWRSVFWSRRIVSVLVLLDATDTDKLGIYSTLRFFRLLLSKVNQGGRASQSAQII